MPGSGGRVMLSPVNRLPERRASPAPLLGFRCSACGYGAVRRSEPHRCPMCGSTSWETEGWRPYAALLGGLSAEIEEPDAAEATAPLQREASELEAGGILPGVPFS